MSNLDIGQKAPDFILLDQNEKPVGMGDLLSRSRAVALSEPQV